AGVRDRAVTLQIRVDLVHQRPQRAAERPPGGAELPDAHGGQFQIHPKPLYLLDAPLRRNRVVRLVERDPDREGRAEEGPGVAHARLPRATHPPEERQMTKRAGPLIQGVTRATYLPDGTVQDAAPEVRLAQRSAHHEDRQRDRRHGATTSELRSPLYAAY